MSIFLKFSLVLLSPPSLELPSQLQGLQSSNGQSRGTVLQRTGCGAGESKHSDVDLTDIAVNGAHQRAES